MVVDGGEGDGEIEHDAEMHEGEEEDGQELEAAEEATEPNEEATNQDSPQEEELVADLEVEKPLTRGKPIQSSRAGPNKSGKARVDHGRWVQSKEGTDNWIFVAKGECPNNVCPGTAADEVLRQLLDMSEAASDKELYNAVLASKNWNKLSDKGMRDQACRGHRHEQEFWCKGQAGIGGQLATELDTYEQDWRQKAITRQKAKFAMLEYSKQRRAHEEEHQKALATINQAKELLAQKRKALQLEEAKVKGMEGKVKEALSTSASQLQAGEEALRAKELEEMVAWQQMQNKRQLVTKFRALNKADIAEMIKQQREEEKKGHA